MSIKLMLAFSKIGFFGFGGGLAMLPIIFQTAKHFGMTDSKEFGNLVAISQVTPGPLSINAATYVGYYNGSFAGAAAATIGIAIPSFIMVIIVSYFVDKFSESKIVQGVLIGVKPVTVGLIASAGLFMVMNMAKEPNWVSMVILLGTIIVYGKWKINPFILIILAGVLGALFIR